MATIETGHPTALALTRALHTGDTETLGHLLGEEPGLATVRLGDDDPGGTSRPLLHVLADWPGHYPHGAASVAILVAAGADVNGRFRGPHDETALHWAASSNDVGLLDALLDAGADIDASGAVIAGGTPLQDARAFQSWEAAFRLVERGAAVDLFDAATLGLMDHLTARWADEPPSADETDRAFWSACHGGRLEAAQFLLACGAALDAVAPWEPKNPARRGRGGRQPRAHHLAPLARCAPARPAARGLPGALAQAD